MKRTLVASLLALSTVVTLSGAASANTGAPGFTKTDDPNDVSRRMPIDIKQAQNLQFGLGAPDGSTMFSVESWDPFVEWDDPLQPPVYRLEFRLGYTPQHPGSETLIEITFDDSNNEQYVVTDLVSGQVTEAGQAARPSDTVLAIFVDNDALGSTFYRWSARFVRVRAEVVVERDRAPDQGSIWQAGV